MPKRDLQRTILLKQAEQAIGGRRFLEAEGLCRQMLEKDRRDTAALSLLAFIASEQGMFAEAARFLERCTNLRPRDPSYHINLGMVRTRERRFDRAIQHYQRALKITPGDARAIAGLARSYDETGDPERARALVEPIVSSADSLEPAAILARLELNAGRPEAAVDLAREHLDRAEGPPAARRSLFSTLGKAYERLGEYDLAFEAYSGRAGVGDVSYEPAELETLVDAMIATFTAERVPTLPRANQPSELPVYVIGMPRSGSTLVETIIDAHPGAVGGGEMILLPELGRTLAFEIGSSRLYPECVLEMTQREIDRLSDRYLKQLTAVSGRADRLVDKFLDNYRHVGLISMLMPGARVINAARDPLDNCLSCFAEDLSAELHPYATRLDLLGFVYRQYRRLVDHYREVLDVAWLDVQYEDVVADQEGQSRRVIDFCGLPWDDACLRFHEGGRQAGTASYDQVRRPIYKSSVSRAERFEKHLGPLVEALGG